MYISRKARQNSFQISSPNLHDVYNSSRTLDSEVITSVGICIARCTHEDRKRTGILLWAYFYRFGIRSCLTTISRLSSKITTKQAKTSKVNKVRCILLKILASIYLLESLTWVPIQNHSHTELGPSVSELLRREICYYKTYKGSKKKKDLLRLISLALRNKRDKIRKKANHFTTDSAVVVIES